MIRYWGLLTCLWIGLAGMVACSQLPVSGPEAVEETAGSEAPVLQEAVQETTQDAGVEVTPDASQEEPGREPNGAEPLPDTTGSEDSREVTPEASPKEATQEIASPVERLIDSTGGRVCYENVCVETTQQAMNGSGLGVLFQRPTKPAPQGSVSPPMDVGPDNWKPQDTVFIIFQNVQVPSGVQPTQLRVAFVNSGGRWQFVPTTYDAQKKEWRGETNHLSVWGLVVSGGPCSLCHDTEVCNGGTCQAPTCQSNSDCGSDEYCSTNKNVCFTKPPCTAKRELCNGLDDNCNAQNDEGCQQCRTAADCDPGQQCARGTCVEGCAPDQIRCNGQCTGVFLDTKNCGACGVVCGANRQCVDGACVE